MIHIAACLGLGACSLRRLDWNLHEEIFCRASSLLLTIALLEINSSLNEA
jgi:hypothetical protein